MLTWAVLANGSCTKLLLSVLTGNWGFPLQFRRPLTCVLQSTYKWAESLPEKVCCRIPPTVFDELLALSLLVNHAYTDSQRINPVVSATDASSTGLGACEVTVSEQLSKKLSQLSKTSKTSIPRINKMVGYQET